MAVLNNSNAITTSGSYDINNSLRFRQSASAYLNRTPASGGNLRTWTASFWYKNGAIDSNQTLFSNATSSDSIGFRSSRTIEIYFGAGSAQVVTTQVFRDTAAWYHIVVAVDTTQATASNRIKLYVNGSQVTAFSTATYPSQNYDTSFNKISTAQEIGRRASASDLFLDGYMAEVNWIDGQALTSSSFGETDTTTGVWKPKAYTGTYGTNGFYLKFSDIATTSGSNAGLGKDFSGNANYWTTNNISVTAGSTYDAMIDSPTLTSATVANYAVLNPLTAQGNTVVDGNLKVTLIASATAGLGVRGSLAITSGNKYYWEIQPTTASSVFTVIGIMDANYKFGTDISTAGSNCVFYYKSNGNKIVNGTASSYGTTYAANDIIGVAVDYSANTCTFYLNNVSQGSISLPSTSIDYIPVVGNVNGIADVFQTNFGQRPFSYTPPTGFVRLNTYNLPDSTIKKGNTVMDATLYTGNGGTQNVVNAGTFKPDLVWSKSRSNTESNVLFDSVRGSSNILYSNLTNVEDTGAGNGFNSNGFTATSTGNINTNGQSYVGWQWQAGQGTNTTNTAGSITSTVSVNTTAGFSIVTYTGNGTNGASIGHGLGVSPKLYIIKSRNSASGVWWVSGYPSFGAPFSANNNYLQLDQTNAIGSAATAGTTSSSSTITFNNSGVSVNANTTTYVAYCWAEIAGFSKFGSYTGNGSTDGPFVYTGFRPKFLMIKITNGVNEWIIVDSARATSNVIGNYLLASKSNAEDSGYTLVDFVSNGFKMRNSFAGWNGSSENIIYMAFAENPFKNANAR